MLVKTLSRHGSRGSAPVLKYIFRYVFRDSSITKGRPKKSYVREDDKQTVWDRVGYARAIRSADVQFTRKDIDHLLREKADWSLTRDLLQKSYSGDHAKYVQEYLLNAGKDRENAPFMMTHNIRPFGSLEDITRQFETNEARREHKRKDSPAVHHSIISFSNKDSSKVTDTILKDLLQEYIRLRGQDIMYAIAKHENTASVHAHICMSATRTNGMSSRISKMEFADIKDKLQEYQKERYPFLEHSLPEHGKQRLALKKGVAKYIRDERSSVKNALLDTITTNGSKSTEALLKALESEGYFPYYRANVLTGVLHLESNLKFRFTRIGVDLEAIRKQEERDKKEKEMLEQIANLRSGHQERALDMPLRQEVQERIAAVAEKDIDPLKDIDEIRASRDQDDEREREYETEDDTTESSDSSDDTDDATETDTDNEPDEIEEHEEIEETDDESEDDV